MARHATARPRAGRSREAKVRDLLNRSKRLGLDRDPHFRERMEWLQLDPEDTSLAEMMEEDIQEAEELQRISPDPVRRTLTYNPELLDGPCRLGVIPQNGFPYGLPPDQLQHHLLCMGRTGGGKTTAVTTILRYMLEHFPDVKIVILERKQEFTELTRLPGVKFHLVDLAHLRLNVLRPPLGVPHTMWLSIFSQLAIDHLDILVASAGFIVAQARDLLAERCCLDDHARPHPHLRDLHEFIESRKYPAMSRFARHQETVLNRLETVLDAFPGVFECDVGLDAPTLLRENMLILLHGIPNLTHQDFLVGLLSAQLFLYRIITEGHQAELRNLLVLDEAANLFRRQQEIRDKPCFMSSFLAQARAYGIGVIAASQSGSDLSHALMANTATKLLVGGFERGEDLRDFLRTRPTSREHHDLLLSIRERGHAFAADPRHDSLIECIVDRPTDLPAPLQGEEVPQVATECARELGWEDAEALAQPEASTPLEDERPDDPAAGHPHQPVPTDSQPGRDQLELLRSIAERPFITLRDRAAALGVKATRLKSRVESLEAIGLVRRYSVPLGRGRPRDLFEITHEGCETLGVPKPAMKGKGRYLHQWYQLQISEFFREQGYRTEIEGGADDKLVDLVATKLPDGDTIAIEIELHVKDSDHYLHNLAADLTNPRFDRVLCLVTKLAEKNRVSEGILGVPAIRANISKLRLDLTHNYMEVAASRKKVGE